MNIPSFEHVTKIEYEANRVNRTLPADVITCSEVPPEAHEWCLYTFYDRWQSVGSTYFAKMGVLLLDKLITDEGGTVTARFRDLRDTTIDRDLSVHRSGDLYFFNRDGSAVTGYLAQLHDFRA